MNAEFTTHEVELDAGVGEEQVTAQLHKLFTSPGYRPPQLPKVALELSALAARPQVQAGEVAKLLEQDAMLSGQVLKAANSARFGGRESILSIKQAVVRMGLDAVRNIVLEAALNMRVFRAEGYTEVMDQLRIHSSATANIARIICRYTSLEGEFAFSLGLLHDVGIAASLLALSELSPRPALGDVWNAVERIHCETAGTVLAAWQVPAEMALIIRNHHTDKIQGYAHPLVAVLSLAEELAAKLGAPLDPSLLPAKAAKPNSLMSSLGGSVGEGHAAMHPQLAHQLLRLDERQWQLVVKDAEAVLNGAAKPAS